MKAGIRGFILILVCVGLVGCTSKTTQTTAATVTVTFMNGEELLGSVQTSQGQILDATSYSAWEVVEDAEFLGWFKTPTYLEASRVDFTTETFAENTTVYGCFKNLNVAEDTRVWYIVGTSNKGTLAQTNWAAEVDDATKEAFELKATGEVNEFEINLDLYAGDLFQIIHDWAWNGQMGFGYVGEYDETQIKNAGGLSGEDKSSNIEVLIDGNYTITLYTNLEDENLATISIVRNGDAAPATETIAQETEFVIDENTSVKVKGSWISDWSELKDLERISEGIFEIAMELEAGVEVYFSVFSGDSDTGLGMNASCVTDEASKTLVEEAYNIKVKDAGTYVFTVDLDAFTVSVTKQ